VTEHWLDVTVTQQTMVCTLIHHSGPSVLPLQLTCSLFAVAKRKHQKSTLTNKTVNDETSSVHSASCWHKIRRKARKDTICTALPPANKIHCNDAWISLSAALHTRGTGTKGLKGIDRPL